MSELVVITGYNGGLGHAVTQAFLDAGYTVAGVSRSAAAAGRFQIYQSDLTDATALIQRIEADLGPIAAAVHLAGSFATGRVEETTDADLDQLLDVNLKSAWRLFRAVLPPMQNRQRGALVAVGSKAANDPFPGAAAYLASKAALAALMKSIAVENPGITANLVTPGTMDTPANRAAMPDADFTQWERVEDVAAQILHFIQAKP